MTLTSDHHRLSRLPLWISRWLGYRPPHSTSHLHHKSHIIWIWSFIGAFLGISVIQAVFQQARYFVQKGVPSIITSYGASAVLIYGVPDSPLAQPRPLIFGHFFGALTGLCITQIFRACIHDQERFENLMWLAASLSCATSIVVMQITRTVHPPGGATAVLPALSADVRDIGWYFLPVVLLTSTLAMAVALIVDNIQRKYPHFWFYPHSPSSSHVDQHPHADGNRPTSYILPTTDRRTSYILPVSNSEVVLDEMMDNAKRHVGFGLGRMDSEVGSSTLMVKLS